MTGHSLTKVPSAVYPLFAVMAFAVTGASYFLFNRATRQEVVWARKSNPEPWNTISQHQTSKLYDSTGRFEKWSRFSS